MASAKLVASYHPTILLRGFDVAEVEAQFRQGGFAQITLETLKQSKSVKTRQPVVPVLAVPATAFEAGHDAPDHTVKTIRTRNGTQLFLFLSGTGHEPEDVPLLCAWCRNPVPTGFRWGIPVRMEEHIDPQTGHASSHVWMEDCTCNPRCSLSLIRQKQAFIFRYRNPHYTDSESLLRHIVWLLSPETEDGSVNLDPAPPNTLRADRGGPLQPSQFGGGVFAQIPFTTLPGAKLPTQVPVRVQFHPARSSFMKLNPPHA